MSASKPSTPVSSPKLLHQPTITSIIQSPPQSQPQLQPPSTPPPRSSRTKRRSYGVFESPERLKENSSSTATTQNDLTVPSLPFTPSTKRRSYGLFDSPVGKSPYGVALKTPRNEDYSPEQHQGQHGDDDIEDDHEKRLLKLQKTPQFSSAKRLYDTLNSAMSRSPNIFASARASISYREQLQNTSPTKVSPVKFPTTPSPPNSKHLHHVPVPGHNHSHSHSHSHSYSYSGSQIPALPFTPSTKRRSYGLFESPVSKSPSTVPLDTPMNDEVDAKEAIKKMLEKRNGGATASTSMSATGAGAGAGTGANSNPRVAPINLALDKDENMKENDSSNNSTPTPNLPSLKLPSLDSRFTEREAAFSLVKLQSVTGHEDDTETEDEDDMS